MGFSILYKNSLLLLLLLLLSVIRLNKHPDEKRNIWKFPSVLENENKIGNNYEKSSPPSSDYAKNTPTNKF